MHQFLGLDFSMQELYRDSEGREPEYPGYYREAAIHVAEASGTFLETSKNIQSAVEEIESGVNKLDTGSDNCMSQMDSLSSNT